MPIYEKTKLHHMNITVEELGNKHQLNPDNSGICRIDDCLAYSDASGLFRCDILSIFASGLSQLYRVILKHGNTTLNIVLNGNCEVLDVNNHYVSIISGSLKSTTSIKVIENEVCPYTVIEVIPLRTIGYSYRIKTSRQNYVTAEGLVVKSD